MRPKSPEEWKAEYTWLTPEQFAEAAQLPSASMVRSLIRSGESEALSPGNVMDVSRSKRPLYRIHPRAIAAYRKESVQRLEEHVTS